MSFPENFWVVAGTAAPVIALAAVISLTEIARTRTTVSNASIRAFYVAHKDKTNVYYRSLNKRESSITRLSGVQLVNLCIQAGLMAVSLLSLAFHRNLIPVWICVVVPTVGVLLLAYAGLSVTSAQEQTRDNEESLDQDERMRQTLDRVAQLFAQAAQTETDSQSGQPPQASGEDV